MRKKTISLLAFTLAVCFSHCLPCSAGAFQNKTDNEVHLVSIYEAVSYTHLTLPTTPYV